VNHARSLESEREVLLALRELEEYAKRALPILHKRLAQAGVRLAWLLNLALK